MASTNPQPVSPPTPLQRLLRLLNTEKRDIGYVYLYAIVTGLIGLSLPLGIQAVFNLVQSGAVFSSIYLLIGLVIVGVILTGLLLIGQTTLVEIIQQRIFAKAALEFTYRLPRITPDALEPYYPPELMNRFFDILTIQKGLPKLLIDITAAFVQIIFGIILLSIYHPVFLVFGLFTVLMVLAVVFINGRKALKASLNESKYKYKVVSWLEDIARDLAFYRQQHTDLEPIDRMDELVANYLKYRNEHFSVLKRFYGNAVAFKTILTGGLLIVGTMLVVSRGMTMGQFVAAEVMIVLITSSVEKLTMNIDVVFDLLTAVEKMGVVTDLPLEDQLSL